MRSNPKIIRRLGGLVDGARTQAVGGVSFVDHRQPAAPSVVKGSGMTFGQKLAAITNPSNRRRVARAASLPKDAIKDHIRKGHTPTGKRCVQIAHALNVPVDWLLDDRQGMPLPATAGRTVDARLRRLVITAIGMIDAPTLLQVLAIVGPAINWRESVDD